MNMLTRAMTWMLAAALVCLALAGIGATAWRAASAAPAADRNPGHLRMALVSIKCVYSDGPNAAANKAAIEANLRRHTYFIDRAVAQGAEFVGFPELSINGYRFSDRMTWLALDGPEVKALARKAAEKGIYISAGIAEQDADGKRWNTQFVVGPAGTVVGWHHKIWLTKEKGLVEAGSDHNVFEVKGAKMGILICADGTDQKNLQALAAAGARIIYAPHANTTGGTIAGWYRFRAAWGGPDGWVAQLKVHAALHNMAGLYNPELDPPPGPDANSGWASGAWFIGPDGRTLAQMPPSAQKGDSKECLLVYNIPIQPQAAAATGHLPTHSLVDFKPPPCTLLVYARGDLTWRP
jgi:predicted amidohydrolase